ncbi:YMGG-like glycine zipper-containing protein [Acidithiobacillus sulfuriphilus]
MNHFPIGTKSRILGLFVPYELSLSLLAMVTLSGCVYTAGAPPGEAVGATQGALLGGVAGAIIGNQSRHPLAGAAVGAGLGALAGAAIGSNNAAAAPNCPPGYVCTPVEAPPPPSGIPPAIYAPEPEFPSSPPTMAWYPPLQAYIAVGFPFPFFYFGGAYYYQYGGFWYSGPGYRGPWRPVRVLPPTFRGFHGQDWDGYQNQARRYLSNPQWGRFRAGGRGR